MATNLTREQIAQIQQLLGSGQEANLDGRSYFRSDSSGYGDPGFMGYDRIEGSKGYDDYVGKNRDRYGEDGSYQSTDQFAERESMAKTAALYAAILGTVGAAGGMFAGAGAGGTGGAAAGGGEMVNGAFLGEAPFTATGGGALDFGAASAAAGGAGAAGAAGGASTLASILGGSSGLLGAGATVLGGLAGAQGQQSEQTLARDIPEWLKPSVNKMLGYSGGLLDQQMAPGAMAGYDQMKAVGQGLLNQPIAGNGFGLFSGRR